MRIDWWTLGLQTINVLILVWILGRFLFRPVADIVAARRAEAEKTLAEARAARAAAETARAEVEAEAARRAADRDRLVAAATAEAETAKTALLAEARAEADRLRAAAEDEIRRAHATESARAADRAGRLAVDIAARLMTRLPKEAQVAGFVDGLAAAVATLPEATRASLAAADAHPILKTPRPLEPAEHEAVAAALARVLGHPVDLDLGVDPSLVAGLELETPHAVVRNSLAADLARIEAELTRHDTP
jgi:F-type H+-transporting ATPase subunit b